MTNEFPSHWPACCPPHDAEATVGLYFRVGKNNPPIREDFQSQAELNRAFGADPCKREGLSMLRNLTDAKHLIRVNQRLGSVIYQGELNTTHGRSKLTSSQTSPTHTTWWPVVDVDRAAPFKVVNG